MNSRTAAFDRAIVFFLGLAFVCGGLWSVGLFFDIPLAQQIADRIDFSAWLAAPQQQWFDALLVTILIVSALLGFRLIAINLHRHRIGRVTSPASGTTGTIEINLATLAAAIATDLEIHPSIGSVKHHVAKSWGRPTMTLTIHVGAGMSLVWLRTVLEEAENDFQAATPGIDVDTIYLVHLDAVDS